MIRVTYLLETPGDPRAMAEKIGFDAYGVSGDMPDPVARAIGQMLDHRLVQFGLIPNRLSHKTSQLTDLAPQTQ